jgi:hypothetical protein
MDKQSQHFRGDSRADSSSSFSPGKKARPRQLSITPWQTLSWTKKIIELRKRWGSSRKTQTLCQ